MSSLIYQGQKQDRNGVALPEMNAIIHRPITFYEHYHYGDLVYDPYEENDGEESDQVPGEEKNFELLPNDKDHRKTFRTSADRDKSPAASSLYCFCTGKPCILSEIKKDERRP